MLPNLSSAAVHTVGIEPHTPVIDVLKGTMGKGVHNPAVNNFSSCSYQTPHVGADATDTLNLPPRKSSSVNSASLKVLILRCLLNWLSLSTK